MIPTRAATTLFVALALVGCRGGDDVVDEPAECGSEDEFGANSSRPHAAIITSDAFAGGTYAATGFLCQGDTDWFAIELAAGQTLEFSIAFETTAGDLDLLLESSEGSLLDESATVRGDESVTYTATTDQTVYVIVQGRESSVENGYEISASLSGDACSPDVLEPNDSGTEPADLDVGSYTDLTVCYGEDDWYDIPAVEGQVVSAQLLFDPAVTELSATMYRRRDNGALQYLGGSQETAEGAEAVIRMSNDGPYLLHVSRGTQTLAANYDLELDITGDACTSDANEPNDGYYSPSMLTGNSSLTGQTICFGDNDFYQFDVANGQVIDAEILFDNDDGDLAFRLYELLDDGTVITRATSNSYTDNEYIQYRPIDDGTYLLWVWPTRGSATGAYDLDLQLTGDACLDDLFEPNNQYGEAVEITAGTYSNTLCTGDDDWYSLEAGNGQLINADVSFIHDDSDIGVQVYKLNDDGTVSLRSNANTLTDNENLSYRPYDDGTFLLRVYRSRGTALASYTLDFSVDGDACLPDAQEPNNAYPEAAAVTPGSYPGQTLCAGDADWYEIEAGNGQIIDIDLSFVHADNDLGVTLYRRFDDGTLSGRASSNTLSDDESINYRSYEDGTFLAYVYRTRGTAVADYDMDIAVSGTPCVSDSNEPNDAAPQAVPMVAGSYPGQTMCVGDADWYSVDAINGQLITARIDFSHADSDLGLNVYKLNSDGTWSYRAGSNTVTDNEQVLYRPYDDGTFLVYAYRSRGAQLADYDLTLDVTGTGCSTDSFEPNNHWTQTAPLTAGSYPSLSLCVGDDDWYEFPAGNGQLISALASFSHAQNDLGLRIYEKRPDGTIITRTTADSLSDNEWALYTPYQDADFLLRVYRSRGTTVASYDLDFDLQGTACVQDFAEPNDHWLQAGDIASIIGTGTATPMTLCISDIDYHDLGVRSAGDVIDIDVNFTHIDGEQDLELYLYRINADNTATWRSRSITADDNESLSYTVPAGEDGLRFVARITRVNGTQRADYDLLVDIN